MKNLHITDTFHWKKVIEGDPESFRVIYEKYIDELYAYGSKFLSDEDDVKDAIHDLFMDLYTYREKLATEVNVRFYLLFSIKRKMIKNSKKNSYPIEFGFAENQALRDFQFSSEEDLIEAENNEYLLKKLNKELENLSARQKEAIFLKFSQNLNYEEIAVLMDINIATCRTLIYRSIKQLRTKLQHHTLSKSFSFILQ